MNKIKWIDKWIDIKWIDSIIQYIHYNFKSEIFGIRYKTFLVTYVNWNIDSYLRLKTFSHLKYFI